MKIAILISALYKYYYYYYYYYDSSFAVQFSISVSKTGAILLFKIKIKLIEMLELHKRVPGMRSAEYQATIPLKFVIIIHNYVNV